MNVQQITNFDTLNSTLQQAATHNVILKTQELVIKNIKQIHTELGSEDKIHTTMSNMKETIEEANNISSLMSMDINENLYQENTQTIEDELNLMEAQTMEMNKIQTQPKETKIDIIIPLNDPIDEIEILKNELKN
jgi:hypothetical protein